MVTQLDIARLTGLDVSTVSKILNNKPGAVFRKKTIRKVQKAARELGYDPGRLKFMHRREHGRRGTRFPLELSIYLEDGTLFDRGRAIMRDVSLSGALLSGILLMADKGLPLQPHSIGIRLLDGPLKNLEIHSKPVRFLHRKSTIHLAVAFQGVQEAALKRLRRIV